jgi:hypothetical protein
MTIEVFYSRYCLIRTRYTDVLTSTFRRLSSLFYARAPAGLAIVGLPPMPRG